jgi:hypothetical protein
LCHDGRQEEDAALPGVAAMAMAAAHTAAGKIKSNCLRETIIEIPHD